VKEAPGSITLIAERLRRDRSAVKRDVDQLAQAGMVTIEAKIHPGHGQMKEVRAAARRFKLEALVI
jgi:predicted transcriptional regulator